MNNRIPRKPDIILLTLIGGLVAFGLVMVYSSSFYNGYKNFDSSYYWVFRQGLWAIAGTIGLFVTMNYDYRKLRSYSLLLMAFTLFLLVLVLILPKSITQEYGASRWIKIGPMSIQPSEFAKFAAIIYFADWLSRRGSKIRRFMTGLLPFGIMLGLLAGLVLMQPNMSTTIVIVAISAVILFTSGASLIHLSLAGALTLFVSWSAIQSAGYRMQRLLVWQDPFSFAREGGYQPIHSLYALGSGGWFGVGLGQSRQKFDWLPFAHTDAIFPVIGEELGLIGAILLVIAFVVLAVRGFRIAARSTDTFGSLIAIGVTTWFFIQAMINIAVASGVIPFTGITLPFISYGGSSLFMTMVAAGLLLSVTRYAPLKNTEEIAHEPAIPPINQIRPRFAASVDAMRRWHGRARLSRAGNSERTENAGVPKNVAVGSSFAGTWRKPAPPKRRWGFGKRTERPLTAKERVEQRRLNEYSRASRKR